MSSDRVVGTLASRKELLREHKDQETGLGRRDRSAAEARQAHWGERLASYLRPESMNRMDIWPAAHWGERLASYLRAVGKAAKDIASDPRGSPWGVALASAMKSTTTVANPWLPGNPTWAARSA
ncbi:MAG TPA: hypothetical protein PKL08_14635 [Thermoanaerobaculaceae bacterium]|nr:hypothetical protein [Thermoanaerobaculaceae bacterium]